MTLPVLSIVATMYRSAAYIDEFCDRIIRTASAITPAFEIILVNDGSPDDSLTRALAYRTRDPRVKIVDLSRNFGHHAAMVTGLRHSTGGYIYLTDIDLEEEPELLAEFWRVLAQNADTDVIGGVQARRAGTKAGNMFGRTAWALLASLSAVPMTQNLLATRLMTRRFVDALMMYPEREIFIAALCADVGFKQIFIPAQKKPQQETTYTLARKLRLFVVGLVAVTVAPLYLAIYAAFMLVLVMLALGTYAAVTYISGSNVPGWTSIIFLGSLSTALILGVQGIIGLYIAQIAKEVKQRPVAIIRKSYE